MVNCNDRAPRVTFLITASGVGGAEQQVRDLATQFRQRGWDVGVISMMPLEPLLGDLRQLDVKVASLGMSQGVPDPRGLLRLARILRRWKPDVLHGHMVHANLLARVSRILVRTPVVVSTIHNQDEGSQWRYVAYRLTDRLTDATTTMSELAMDEAVRRGAVKRDRIRLIPNGIDVPTEGRDPSVRRATRTALHLADDAFVWLAAGRLTEAKAYPDMIEAFRRVVAAEPTAVLLIAGGGPLEPDVREAIDRAGMGEHIRLLGHRSDVPDLMEAADAFVMSSAWEGLPVVLLEASSRSLPIVATEVGGSREAIVDGVTGRITEPGDPAALSTAILALMALPPSDREAMGRAARDHVTQEFDLKGVVDTWEQLYRDLLSARRA